jgi:hypothetical protein
MNIKYRLFIYLLFCIQLSSCFSSYGKIEKTNDKKNQDRTIQQVLEENTPRLMTVKGVVGTALGICDDNPCIKILVSELTDSIVAQLPQNIEGYPVEIEETGEIKAY